MSSTNRRKLEDRVAQAAEAALAAQKYVSAIDVLLGIGWLNPGTLKSWRQGQSEHLEGVMHVNLSRISEAMRLLRSWARERGLVASETAYVARTPQRQTLRFSKSGDPAIETAYRTHWVSPELSDRKRQRLAEKASRPPELVVVQAAHREWTCHRCGGSGGLIMMENAGPACLGCAGLDDLDFLPAGDAQLTRKARAKSERHAVVVRFSKRRGRYERRGLLLEPQAIEEAERELEEERPTRDRAPPARS